MEENIKESKRAFSLKGRIRSFFAQEFFHNPLIHWVVIASLFVNIASWVVLAIFIKPTDLNIILHYNVYFGVDIIGKWWQVYFLPAVGTTFLVVNFILAYFFYCQKERVASYLFLLASFIIQAGVLIAAASISRINY